MGTLEEQIDEVCKKIGVPGPMAFLAQIMGGHDPRRLSDIYEMVLALEGQYGENEVPDQWDYIELVVKIKERYQYFPVSLSDSHTAAKQIMEYTHAKKKQVDHSGQVGTIAATSPLTAAEVKLFREKFDSAF